MPATRHLDIDEQGDVTIIRFRDERVTDAMEIEDLGRQLYHVLEYKNCDKLVIDFSPVEFLSSATIGKLISLNRKAKVCKTAVRLCGMQQGVRDIFIFAAWTASSRFARMRRRQSRRSERRAKVSALVDRGVAIDAKGLLLWHGTSILQSSSAINFWPTTDV